jgi:hypothetical protein
MKPSGTATGETSPPAQRGSECPALVLIFRAGTGESFVRLPHHPFWFWLILLSPFCALLASRVAAQYRHEWFNHLRPWLKVGFFLSIPAYVLVGVMDGHKALRLVVYAIFYTCWAVHMSTENRYLSETIGGPTSKWYLPWTLAKFSIPRNALVHVSDISSVSMWYLDKLGLHKAAENPWVEADAAIYRFKEGGKSITLTTKNKVTSRPLILFTKRIEKMKGVLRSRGIEVGSIRQDRQGTRYFEIHDPEGNAIEIIEES